MGISNNNHPFPYNKGELADIVFSAILNNDSESIYFKDLNSKFIVLSRHLAHYFGLESPVEAIGKSDFDFFSSIHARQAYNDEQHIIRTQKPLLNVVEAESWKDTKKSFVITSKYPLYDSENTLIGTWGHSITVDALQYSDPLIDAAEANLESYPTVTKIDNLTKLRNVKAFYDDMNLTYQKSMNQMSVPDKDQALVMIDINDFKALNDQYGHHGGDSALLFMTELLQEVKSKDDEIFIYGTDQFAILASVPNIEAAKMRAEKFLRLIESRSFSHDGVDLQLLVSIGMCTFKEVLPMGSIYDIINLADSRLSDSKKLGPNEIVYQRL